MHHLQSKEKKKTSLFQGDSSNHTTGKKKNYLIDNRPRLKNYKRLNAISKGKASVQRFAKSAALLRINTSKDEVIQKKDNKTGLPNHLKSGIESLSGYSMDDVKVHYNSNKPATLQAHAFAQGTDIHLASGQEKHLPHEAWHVAQQKQGRVKPTIQMNRGVNINDDANLEKEANVMGMRALKKSGAIVQPKFVSSINKGVIQRQGVDAEIHGLTHLVLAKEGSIFEGSEYLQVTHETRLVVDNEDKIRSRRGPNQELYTEDDRGGEQNNRWIKVVSVNHKPVPDNVYVRADTITVENARDIAPSGPVGPTRSRPVDPAMEMGHMATSKRELSPADQARWNALGKYTSITVAAPEKQPINKVEGFDHSKYPEVAQEYIDQFQIISKRQFNNKINEIALGVMRLGAYSCIVSEVGKSNFWLTGKVLDQVRRLGGAPPKRVISLPVKEKGAMDNRKSGAYAKQLKDAGHIVFIDDGSYSGNQLVKFINHVIGTADIPHSIGLVASTRQARERIGARDGRPAEALATPIPIETFAGGDMDEAYRSMSLPVHHDRMDKREEPRDGDALSGLHYKVPDYASVRHKLLVGDKTNPGPITGYDQGSGLPVRVHGKIHIGRRGGTEPYKSVDFLKSIAEEESLSSLGIEDPTPKVK